LVLPAAASAHGAAATLKFTAVTRQEISWYYRAAFQGTDVTSKGTDVGFDVVYFRHRNCCVASAHVTFALRGGLLYGIFHTSFRPVFSGTVTGGNGEFQGVTGSINGTTNGTFTRMKFTITYS
jgi:hypothetical protein